MWEQFVLVLFLLPTVVIYCMLCFPIQAVKSGLQGFRLNPSLSIPTDEPWYDETILFWNVILNLKRWILFYIRYGAIDSQQKCSLCSFPLVTRSFYFFPCSHTFHSDCLVTEVKLFIFFFYFSIYLWMFAYDSLFNSNKLLSIRVLSSLWNAYEGAYGISSGWQFHHWRPHRGLNSGLRTFWS